jgi:hypothetical protein
VKCFYTCYLKYFEKQPYNNLNLTKCWKPILMSCPYVELDRAACEICKIRTQDTFSTRVPQNILRRFVRKCGVNT